MGPGLGQRLRVPATVKRTTLTHSQLALDDDRWGPTPNQLPRKQRPSQLLGGSYFSPETWSIDDGGRRRRRFTAPLDVVQVPIERVEQEGPSALAQRPNGRRKDRRRWLPRRSYSGELAILSYRDLNFD